MVRAHTGVIHQPPQEGAVGPAQTGLGLFRSDGITRVGLQRGVNFHLAHQTGVHADQIQLFQAGIALDLGESIVQFGEIERIFFQAFGQQRGTRVRPARCGVTPAARPPHAMIGHN